MCRAEPMVMRVRRTPFGTNQQHMLLLAIVVACLARTTHSFFSPFRIPAKDVLGPFRACGVQHVCRLAPHNRRSTTSLFGGEDGLGTGGNHNSSDASGRRRRLNGRQGGENKATGSSDQGTMIHGPPRLENVPEKELDTIHVFREERPGRIPRAIECYADKLAIVGGRRYMIGHPCDWAVSVCVPKDDHSVEAVPLDSDLMEELIPGLQRELEVEDVHLFATPVTLTLQGEFLDDEDDEEDDDGGDDEGDDDEDNNDLIQSAYDQEHVEFEVLENVESLEDAGASHASEEDEDMEDDLQEVRIPTDINVEGVELIASYWHDNQEYALVRHLDPVFVMARQTPKPNGYHYYLLGTDEAAAVKPKVEQMLLQEIELAKEKENASNKDGLGRRLDWAGCA